MLYNDNALYLNKGESMILQILALSVLIRVVMMIVFIAFLKHDDLQNIVTIIISILTASSIHFLFLQ